MTAVDDLVGEDVPKEVIDALESGDPGPLIDFMAQNGIVPTPEEIEALKNKAYQYNLPPIVVPAVEAYVNSLTTTLKPLSAQVVAELTQLSGGLELPADLETSLAEGDFAALPAWLEAEDIHPPLSQYGEDRSELPSGLAAEIDNYLKGTLPSEAMDALGSLVGGKASSQGSD